MSIFDIDLSSGGGSRTSCAEAICWELNSSGSVSSPSQHTFFDWLREQRISYESDWQPDLADLLTTLAGEDFRVFALEDKNSSLCRTESSNSGSPTRAGSSGAISEMSNRFCLCFLTYGPLSCVMSNRVHAATSGRKYGFQTINWISITGRACSSPWTLMR